MPNLETAPDSQDLSLPPLPRLGGLIPEEMQRDLHATMQEYARQALAMQPLLHDTARLRAALEQLRSAHRFNVAALRPAEVHQLCFEALGGAPAEALPAELSPERGAQAAPLFAANVAARKWAGLQAEGARMNLIVFEGHKSGQLGSIDSWGVVRWGKAALAGMKGAAGDTSPGSDAKPAGAD